MRKFIFQLDVGHRFILRSFEFVFLFLDQLDTVQLLRPLCVERFNQLAQLFSRFLIPAKFTINMDMALKK